MVGVFFVFHGPKKKQPFCAPNLKNEGFLWLKEMSQKVAKILIFSPGLRPEWSDTQRA